MWGSETLLTVTPDPIELGGPKTWAAAKGNQPRSRVSILLWYFPRFLPANCSGSPHSNCHRNEHVVKPGARRIHHERGITASLCLSSASGEWGCNRVEEHSFGGGSKKWYQNDTFLNGDQQQNLRNPRSLILSHTHFGGNLLTAGSFKPQPPGEKKTDCLFRKCRRSRAG